MRNLLQSATDALHLLRFIFLRRFTCNKQNDLLTHPATSGLVKTRQFFYNEIKLEKERDSCCRKGNPVKTETEVFS